MDEEAAERSHRRFICPSVGRHQAHVGSLELREVAPEEQSHVAVDLALLDFVEDKRICGFGQPLEPEAISDVRLWATGNEDLDLHVRHLGRKLPEDGKDC